MSVIFTRSDLFDSDLQLILFTSVCAGMEFLVPKTGFFCKVCNRFFSGTNEAEINHCKTLKHYDNIHVRKHTHTQIYC